jgi:hypothetical protein
MIWVALAIADEGTVYGTAGPFESEAAADTWINQRGIDACHWQAVEIDSPEVAASRWEN